MAFASDFSPNYSAIPLSNYIALLKAHDWSYEFSSDHRVWLKGSAEAVQLKELRAQLDEDAVIWDQIAPAPYRVNR